MYAKLLQSTIRMIAKQSITCEKGEKTMSSIFAVAKVINASTNQVHTTEVIYKSGYRRYYAASDPIPERINDFIKMSKNVKEYECTQTNYIFPALKEIIYYRN